MAFIFIKSCATHVYCEMVFFQPILDFIVSLITYDCFCLFQVLAGSLFVLLSLVHISRSLFVVNSRSRTRPYVRETSQIYLNKTCIDSHPRPSDWTCRSESRWRDLGMRHYPRFVREVVCTSDTCYHDFYTCTPDYYSLVVLTTRHPRHGAETALPDQLRDDWIFNTVNVSVACMCMSRN